MRTTNRPRLTRCFLLLLLLLAGRQAAFADPVAYVHFSDPTCAGLTPCFSRIDPAVQDVDNDGEVIILSNGVDSIHFNQGKTGLTLRGNPSTVTITGGINMTTGTTTGWTIRDLVFTAGILIQDIATSLHFEDITATGIQIGAFTQDTDASIVMRAVTMGGTPQSLISIIGEPGFDIAGSILVEDCINLRAINVMSWVEPGSTADITADITFARNDVSHGPRVIVNSTGAFGVGDITGTILFDSNTMSPLNGKFGVSHNGGASGAISGSVTAVNNDAAWLAIIATDSIVGGSIGPLTVTGNTLHAVEISAYKAPLHGPVFVDDNLIIDRGLPEPVRIQTDGGPVAGQVTITNTQGGAAFIAIQSAESAASGQWTIADNDGIRMVVDSTGGSITGNVEIANNILTPAPAPESSLTIRTFSGGSLGTGTIVDNVLDTIQFDLDGSLAADFVTSQNTVRENASFIAFGPTGPGTHTLVGNDIQGPTYFDGLTTNSTFNRFDGYVTRVATATVDASHNWWGCNLGPAAVGCSGSTPSLAVAPWLTLSSRVTCLSPGVGRVDFDVLTSSDLTELPGNITPVQVDLSTSLGAVTPTMVGLTAGSGQSQAVWPSEQVVTVSVQLDSEIVQWTGDCLDLIFVDSFESGDTGEWL